jgi:very-short-patch-repair endonuclease
MLAVLHEALAELGGRGRGGTSAMRQILAARPVGTRVPASGLEARFESILRNAGLPAFDRQVDVGGHEWIGRVDFCDRRLGLLVEVDSDLHHSSTLDVGADRVRDEALVAAGWRRVLRVRQTDVWNRPWLVVDDVRAARAALAA